MRCRTKLHCSHDSHNHPGKTRPNEAVQLSYICVKVRKTNFVWAGVKAVMSVFIALSSDLLLLAPSTYIASWGLKFSMCGGGGGGGGGGSGTEDRLVGGWVGWVGKRYWLMVGWVEEEVKEEEEEEEGERVKEGGGKGCDVPTISHSYFEFM